jgi:hypothetical protein
MKSLKLRIDKLYASVDSLTQENVESAIEDLKRQLSDIYLEFVNLKSIDDDQRERLFDVIKTNIDAYGYDYAKKTFDHEFFESSDEDLAYMTKQLLQKTFLNGDWNE